MEWKLPEATCLSLWVLGQCRGCGYYRARYEDGLLAPLLADGGRRLSAAERVAALGDVDALTTMGEIKAGDALALAPQFAGDPVRQVVSSVIGIAAACATTWCPTSCCPITGGLSTNVRRAGPPTGLDGEAGRRRRNAAAARQIRAAGGLVGEDPALAAEARQLAGKWLADRSAVDPDIAGSVLTVAARTGDEAFFKQLQAALPGTEDRQQRDSSSAPWVPFAIRRSRGSAMDLVLKPEWTSARPSACCLDPRPRRPPSFALRIRDRRTTRPSSPGYPPDRRSDRRVPAFRGRPAFATSNPATL